MKKGSQTRGSSFHSVFASVHLGASFFSREIEILTFSETHKRTESGWMLHMSSIILCGLSFLKHSHISTEVRAAKQPWQPMLKKILCEPVPAEPSLLLSLLLCATFLHKQTQQKQWVGAAMRCSCVRLCELCLSSRMLNETQRVSFLRPVPQARREAGEGKMEV